jgi:hypothetical protein
MAPAAVDEDGSAAEAEAALILESLKGDCVPQSRTRTPGPTVAQRSPQRVQGTAAAVCTLHAANAALRPGRGPIAAVPSLGKRKLQGLPGGDAFHARLAPSLRTGAAVKPALQQPPVFLSTPARVS